MSRFQGYLKTAAAALSHYDGAKPLAHYLKTLFAQRKQMGSRDRRLVTALCYAIFRLGRYAAERTLEERLLLAAHLPGIWPPEALQALATEWQQLRAQGVELPHISKHAHLLFAPAEWLSAGVAAHSLAAAMLQQPALFLRIRPGAQKTTVQWLQQHNIAFRSVGDNCLQLPNGTQLTGFPLNKWAVVQDASSQETGRVLQAWLQQHQLPIPAAVWDCCAASGGKSIMLADQWPGLSLTVSDIRPSILHNLRLRFAEAGLAQPQSAVLDLAQQPALPWKQRFDMVLADVPCSGSGTWARTPEQAAFFSETQLPTFHEKQYRIAAYTSKALKPGGLLVYITCSVFAAENEAVVKRLCGSAGLRLIEQRLIDGTANAADCMFIALLQMPAS